MKNLLTQAGIEPATYRFVAQHLNHCATAAPPLPKYVSENNYVKTAGERLEYILFHILNFIQDI